MKRRASLASSWHPQHQRPSLSIHSLSFSTQPTPTPTTATPTQPNPTPNPPFSSATPPKGIHSFPPSLESARSHAHSLLSTLNLSARSRAKSFSDALAALELERKLAQVGGKINKATGYEEIERLRIGVVEREKELLRVREVATKSKEDYTEAVEKRMKSQREVNDLLQRKSNWSSADVLRCVCLFHFCVFYTSLTILFSVYSTPDSQI